MAWTKGIEIKENSVYGKGFQHSKQWWRKFIRPVAAAGYIRRIIKTASFGKSNGVYASVTEKARDAIADEKGVLLPEYLSDNEQSSHLHTSKEQLLEKEKGTNGCHLIPQVKMLLEGEENWKEITDK